MSLEFAHEIYFIIASDIVSITRLFTQEEEREIVLTITRKSHHETHLLTEEISLQHLDIIRLEQYYKIPKSSLVFGDLSDHFGHLYRADLVELFLEES
jgi:hypothetical protein